ncbi:MAG: nitroreductase family protein [Massilibacteroides sp.]|nr:nitroreductase family protein [Massilibacteroides sp.]
MADNYIEKKFEDLQHSMQRRKQSKGPHTILQLLLNNRSYRGYDESIVVTENMLNRLLEVVNKIPSAMNQQVLRYKKVWGAEGEAFSKTLKMGAALSELHLPLEGNYPKAFVLIYATIPETKWVDIDLGIAAQSILLKAVEMGLNGICLGDFNRKKLKETFKLENEPLLLLAIGKGNETIERIEISEDESHSYYRVGGRHLVPKVKLEDLIS